MYGDMLEQCETRKTMLFSAAAAAAIITYANLVACSPSVQLNGTTVVGQSFPELNQEFFGGELSYC